MKKFLITLTVLFLILAGGVYMVLDSSTFLQSVLERVAPRYHFSYGRVSGTPLRGVVIEDLSYKELPLAKRIDLRVNPLSLLRWRITVSRLHLSDVRIDTLEWLVEDFSTPPEANRSAPADEAPAALPLSVLVKDIELTLPLFYRGGVRVASTRVRIDSILYDGERFAVGDLKLLADTSVGEVEFEGTYRRRYLDVKILALEDLDLEGILRALDRGNKPSAKSAPEETKEQNTTRSTRKGPSPFFPRGIHAQKLWITLKEYRLSPEARLIWGQLEGRNLEVDLEHSKVLEGNLTAEVESNLLEGRLQLGLSADRYRIRRGVIEQVDLPALSAWLTGGNSAQSDKSETDAAEGNGSTRQIPFVAPKLEIGQLRLALKEDQNLSGVKVASGVLNLREATYDLPGNVLELRSLSGYADTSVAALHLAGGVDTQRIRIDSLELSRLDLKALEALQKQSSPAESNATAPNPSGTTDASSGSGTHAPIPSRVEIRDALLTLAPLERKEIRIRKASARLRDLKADWQKREVLAGRIRARLESDLLRADLNGTLSQSTLILDPKEGSAVRLEPELFHRWKIPLRSRAFSPLNLEGRVTPEEARITLRFNAQDILEGEEGKRLQVNFKRSETAAHYRFRDGSLTVTHHSLVSTPQVPEIRADLNLSKEGNATLSYRGRIRGSGLKLGNAKLERLLGRPLITLRGDLHRAELKMKAGVLRGEALSRDMKKAHILLETPDPVELGHYLSLPKKLEKARASLRLESDLNLSAPLPALGKLSLESNLFNLQGDLGYDGNATGDLKLTWPAKSLLEAFDPKLHLRQIGPLRLSLRQQKERYLLGVKGALFDLKAAYSGSDKPLSLEGHLGNTSIKGSGSWPQKLSLQASAPSLRSLLERVNRIYAIEPIPPFNGDVEIRATLKEKKELQATIRSKALIPDDTARIKSPVTDLLIELRGDLGAKELRIPRYRFTVDGMKLHAQKPSQLRLKGDTLILDRFWINDSLQIRGSYDQRKAQGEFRSRAGRFVLDHPLAKVEAKVDLRTKIRGEKIDTQGEITILGGEVRYNIESKRYATDEDIIILQHLKKKEESFFRKNVGLSILIKSAQPLVMKQKSLRVDLLPHLSLLKGYGDDLQMIGSVELGVGGYYLFEGKKFVLESSRINFTGNPSQPLLDIHLRYRRYSYTVYIAVTGRATEPTLNFSSDPYMTRNQILSLILFDTVDAGEDPQNMLSLVGGGIAKSILGNIGLKVDTLVLTQEGFEVGKKITDKITVIYDQKKEPRVIVRIQHSKHTETDISIGNESQSVDIIYKREF